MAARAYGARTRAAARKKTPRQGEARAPPLPALRVPALRLEARCVESRRPVTPRTERGSDVEGPSANAFDLGGDVFGLRGAVLGTLAAHRCCAFAHLVLRG